jgi:RNA polymerase sigma factor (sigma-70 family)
VTLQAPIAPPNLANRSNRAAVLGDASLVSALTRYVRSRVPGDDADDVVQATLADALAAREAPDDEREIKLWVYGIARNKVADFFRRGRREVLRDPNVVDEDAAPESAGNAGAAGARDLLRWAKRELPTGEGAESTLEWMIREGEGEKLEAIAAEANVPAPRVRQRVARLRRHFRARWAAQIAAALAVVGLAIAVYYATRTPPVARKLPAPVESAPFVVTPEERAKEIRKIALEECERQEWRPCIDGLDSAKALDPAGDTSDRVTRARRLAEKALAPPEPPPAPKTSSVTPTGSGWSSIPMTKESGKAPPITGFGSTPMGTSSSPPPAPAPVGTTATPTTISK